MKTRIVAHRGYARVAPENTIPAFEAAISCGADAIECDVHLTADGALVIHHDYYLGRTTTGTGAISDHSLDALQALEAGHWFHSRFAGLRIPTLDQVLELTRGQVQLELELRTPDHRLVPCVHAHLDRFGMRNDVEITSEHVPLLTALRTCDAQIRTGFFFRPPPPWMEASLWLQHVLGWMALGAAHVAHLPRECLTDAVVTTLRAKGYMVHGANLNTEHDIVHALQLQVDQFSTDELNVAIMLRER